MPLGLGPRFSPSPNWGCDGQEVSERSGTRQQQPKQPTLAPSLPLPLSWLCWQGMKHTCGLVREQEAISLCNLNEMSLPACCLFPLAPPLLENESNREMWSFLVNAFAPETLPSSPALRLHPHAPARSGPSVWEARASGGAAPGPAKGDKGQGEAKHTGAQATNCNGDDNMK